MEGGQDLRSRRDPMSIKRKPIGEKKRKRSKLLVEDPTGERGEFAGTPKANEMKNKKSGELLNVESVPDIEKNKTQCRGMGTRQG